MLRKDSTESKKASHEAAATEEGDMLMAIRKTGNGYRIRWYDPDGMERQKALRGSAEDWP